MDSIAKAAPGTVATLPVVEQRQLIARKKRARRISQAAGTLGLTALAARIPQGVKVATAHTPTLRATEAVRRIIAVEPRATSASNALTTMGAGVGSTGSFNFAGIQRQEAKAEEKQLRPVRKATGFVPNKVRAVRTAKGTFKRTGRVRGWADREVGFLRSPTVSVNSKGEARVIAHGSDGTLPLSAMADVRPTRGAYDAFETKQSPLLPGGNPVRARVSKRLPAAVRDGAAKGPYAVLRRAANQAGHETSKLSAVRLNAVRAHNEEIRNRPKGFFEPVDRTLTPGRTKEITEAMYRRRQVGQLQRTGARQQIERLSKGDPVARTRTRSSESSLGYAAAAVGLTGAGAGITAAKWTEPDKAAAIARSIDRSQTALWRNAEGMGRGKSTATARALRSTSLGNQYLRLNRLTRKYPGASAATALGLKGVGVASGVKAWHKRGESTGLSYDVARSRAEAKAKRSVVKADEKVVRRSVAQGDDRFLRRYRERISPDAERGYQYLRAGRNIAARDAAGFGALTAGSVPAAAWSASRRHPVLAGASASLAAGSGAMSVRQGEKAYRWNVRMSKIKARAEQRERDGQYGRARQVLVDKAGVLGAPLSKPRMPGFSTRRGGIVRVGARTFTRRGAIAGTGRMRLS